jgi:hypothetical protein
MLPRARPGVLGDSICAFPLPRQDASQTRVTRVTPHGTSNDTEGVPSISRVARVPRVTPHRHDIMLLVSSCTSP